MHNMLQFMSVGTAGTALACTGYNYSAISAGSRLVSLNWSTSCTPHNFYFNPFIASTALLPVFDRKGNEATRFIVHLRIKPTETARRTENKA